MFLHGGGLDWMASVVSSNSMTLSNLSLFFVVSVNAHYRVISKLTYWRRDVMKALMTKRLCQKLHLPWP